MDSKSNDCRNEVVALELGLLGLARRGSKFAKTLLEELSSGAPVPGSQGSENSVSQ